MRRSVTNALQENYNCFILKIVATENDDWTLWECILLPWQDKILGEYREFTKLYPERIETQQNERNSQEETETFFDKHNGKA